MDTRRGPMLTGINLKFAPPGGTWDAADNGAYEVRVLANHVLDADGNAALGRRIGTFWVRAG
jgi:hypothetical protein